MNKVNKIKMFTLVTVAYVNIPILLILLICNLSIYKKRLPENDVNTSKHVAALYITVNILCVCWSK